MDHKDIIAVELTPQPGVLQHAKPGCRIKNSTQSPKDNDTLHCSTSAKTQPSPSTSSEPLRPPAAAPSQQPLSPSPQPKGYEHKMGTIAEELDAEAAGKRKRETAHYQGIPMSFIREKVHESHSKQADRRRVITPRRMARLEKAFECVGISQESAQSRRKSSVTPLSGSDGDSETDEEDLVIIV